VLVEEAVVNGRLSSVVGSLENGAVVVVVTGEAVRSVAGIVVETSAGLLVEAAVDEPSVVVVITTGESVGG
jgi:hypothetical protein